MRSSFAATGVVAALATVLAATAAPAVDLRPNIPEGAIEISLDAINFVPNLSTEFTPIDVVPFPDGTNRLAMSTVLGTIRVLDANRNVVSAPLLTRAQSGLVPPQEAGMTGIAFHPDFNKPGQFGYGKLYTITTEPRSDTVDGPQLNNVDFSFSTSIYENYQDVVREWNLATFGNIPGNAANNSFTGTLANSREILRVDQPGPFHNVADLTFNRHAQPGDADYGLLYISAGDGGDQRGQLPTSLIRRQRAQSLDNIYGKILRIDPDPTRQAIQRTSVRTGQPSYSVPTTNPFAADEPNESRTASTLAEIYAYGFRSPFRIEFDRQTGDLWMGDVGENSREEINRVQAGGNYGWGEMEGTLDGILPGDGTQIPGLIRPFIEFLRADLHSISGGFVYRGSAIPQLKGKYVFSDLGQGFASGALFYAIVDPNDPAGNVGDVFEFQFAPGSPTFNGLALPARIYSFGEDDAGELYVTAGPDPRQANPSNPQAWIIRLGPGSQLTGIAGDVDQNGVFDPVVDVAAFVAGWNTTGHVGTVARYMHGDLNNDGFTNLTDVFLMHQALQTVGQGFPFAALGLVAPEPASSGMVLAALVAATAARRRRRGRRW
jgi:glucose/arabinose dehydrogenase